ncbi:MAG: hypothetical protein IPL77_00120 [Flavobacteriales bacterium]|nr:hypothetical protein [Flavobacteriales bacterium]
MSRKLGIDVFCGGRVEGIPVEDRWEEVKVSGDLAISTLSSPVLDWMRGRHDVNVSVPAPLYRNRTQSVTDKENTAASTTGRWACMEMRPSPITP